MSQCKFLFLKYFITLLLMVFAHAAAAQSWKPERHVELIVPAETGGSLDQTGRLVHRIWEELKLLPVTSSVANRAGGGHAVAYAYLNQRAGDAHTLSITSSTLLTNHINGRFPFSHQNFTPVGIFLSEYIVIAVQAGSPIKSGKDLMEALKKNPAAYSVALSSAPGGTHHLAFAMPVQSAGVDMKQMKFVSFNSSGPAIAALLGGHVDVVSTSNAIVAPHVQSGKLRVIGISAPKRVPGALADAPTWPEQGYKGVWDNWRAVMGAGKLSADQIAYWEGALRRMTATDTFRQYLDKYNLESNFKGSAETRKLWDDEYAELKGVMSYLGMAK